MKNISRLKATGTILLMFLLLYACKDSFLDVTPKGAANQTQLANIQGAEASLIAVYSQVNGRANRMASPSNWVWGSIRGGEHNKGTDPGDFSDINPIQRFEYQATQGVISDKYNGLYEGVARANNVLRVLPTVDEPTDDIKKRKLAIEAQTKFLRAHFYFELKRTFNNTPYVDETFDYQKGIDKVKNDVDLWPKIEADMQFAYTNLPETQSEVGRVNKWAAAAYLAKIYMYQHKYAEAKALYDDLIPNGKTSNGKAFALQAKFSDVYRASNDNNSESIWAYQAAANTGSVNNANPEFDLNWPYNTGADGPGNCCSFFQPTFEMGNSFRTKDGLPLKNGEYNLPANELKTDMNVDSKAAFTTDPGPVDPRLDHSIGRRYVQYLDWKPFPGKAWIRNQPNAGPYSPKKYIYYKADKGSLQDNSSWTPGYTAINFTVIRFADVLLMAAEAEIEVGSLTKAKDYINQVRARAANPDDFVKGVVTGFQKTKDNTDDYEKPIMDYTQDATLYEIELYDDFADKAEAREAVRFERKLELSGEGHRFYDLVRWTTGDTPDYVNQVITAYLTYEAPKLPSGAFTGAKFDKGKDELLPIPQAQIDIATPSILKQNPGF
ncbi:RagB/SusD family nutrient uptake outer membrane protein [Chryseolinea lacunae]|uniref:RagB/SusD family nutrient uptake outer membrane protein n=1 Tax=Chryseolinea lacunae TaxID=2801331 RepID=A0ABS1KXL1_9BACT|nr:RagB/SusD family nutrient uptake outer membrane protein [Chryseolinea lacunae]MBL0744109.1 RagB/SusD family nutrient uptake outer membrane protein [Chryseolinea lacunae]